MLLCVLPNTVIGKDWDHSFVEPDLKYVFLYSYINSNWMFFLAITRPPIYPAHIQMIC